MKEKTTDREQKGWGPGPRGPCRALRGLSCVAAAPATRGFPSSLCKGHSQTRPGCSPHALGSRSLWGPQQGIRIKGITALQLSLLRWVPVPERSGGGEIRLVSGNEPFTAGRRPTLAGNLRVQTEGLQLTGWESRLCPHIKVSGVKGHLSRAFLFITGR